MAEKYRKMAEIALSDIYKRFWTDSDGGHILPTHCGKIVDKPLMIWETATVLFAMEMFYEACGHQNTKQKILGTWDNIKRCFTDEQMASGFGECPNLALDDTGWDIMAYMLAHRLTKDAYPLDLARRCLLGAYDHWKDGDCQNGLWYNDRKQYDGDHWKSTYIVSLLISALEYSEITRGTELFSPVLDNQTMELYRWVEENMRRDKVVAYHNGLQDGSSFTVDTVDYLYWTDFNVDRETRPERNGPSGGLRPLAITENGSVSALFGNMGMAAFNAKLFRLTGEPQYKRKALETAHSMSSVYNREGAYINDRDPYTNCTMLRYYIHHVLTLPEMLPQERRMVLTTAENIFENGQKNSGIYSSSWRKTPDYDAAAKRGNPESLMINATSVSMICGAALLESMELEC